VVAGTCRRLEELPPDARSILEDARRAALSTLDPDGVPHTVPVTFAIVAGELVTAIDHKPKTGRELRRVKNLRADPTATVMVDRWSEDWDELGWVMLSGRARVELPGTGGAQLTERYPQYREQAPGGDVIVFSPERIRWWLASG
jgi:PPOX class probable F420-dependent enzyme